MVYAGSKDDKRFTLGVSGRLKDNNLIMWDEETGSLWSQILGTALHGDSKGMELDMLPAVFTGLGTWKRMHPDTRVLDLETVEAKPWFYTTDDLAKGRVRARGGEAVLGIGLRHGGDTLGVPLPLLHERGVIATSIGGTPLVAVWHNGEKAALVYEAELGGSTLDLELRDGKLVEKNGARSWDALRGTRDDGDGPALKRFPYLPTYVRAWSTYYPDGRVLEG